MITRSMAAIVTLIILLIPNQCAIAADSSAKPNIIFIMIDDLGWMDLACQGNKLVETPHIDKLATEGIRFTDAYAAAPVCSPTRAAVLTGHAPARLHLTNHAPEQARFTPENAKLLPAPMVDYLPAEKVTIAERLNQAGYATGFFGKWHLSGKTIGKFGKGAAELYPENQGFDLNVGGCCYGGPPSFFSPYKIHSLPDGPEGEYMPDRMTEEAVRFMRANKNGPFLMFLWNYTVHWPMQAPERLLKKYENRKGRGLNDYRYGAMIEAMDTAMGRLFAEIDRLGLRDDTLLVFTSDNGGFGGVADNRPLREAKGHLYEGGIRVPMIVRWPGKVPAGKVSATPTISMDFFPTFLEAAGIEEEKTNPCDGESLLSHLTGGAKLKRDSIYFHYPNYAWHRSNRLGSAVRRGDYKLIERFDDGSVELYDLSKDLGETKNLSREKPQLAASLRSELHDWRKQVNANMPVRN